MDPAVGYNELRDICLELNIPVVTSTAVRHRAATLFWNVDGVDETLISAFMEHMGHSSAIDKNMYAVPPLISAFMEHMGHSFAIDKNVYAVPPAVWELVHVGSLMSNFDQVYTR